MTPRELTAWRLKRGLSQTVFGDLIGVGRRTITTWESGSASIPKMVELALPTIDEKLRESGVYEDLRPLTDAEQAMLNRRRTEATPFHRKGISQHVESED